MNAKLYFSKLNIVSIMMVEGDYNSVKKITLQKRLKTQKENF